MMALLEHRQVIEEVPKHALPRFGTVNELMMLPNESVGEDGNLRLEKVDAVLNAKSCNSWVQLNKAATDYIRAFLPFVGECQDMGVFLERLRVQGSHRFGKLDMLNAYS